MLRFADLTLARYRLAPHLAPTPLEAAPALGADVWLKLENTNKTHAFKVRGALNALLALNDSARARGVVTVSSGNHAQGIAYAAGLLGIEARILMPVYTAKRKVAGVKRYGAQAVLIDDDFAAIEREAHRIEREEGLVYVSAYNDANVIAGQGTIGLEIFDVLPTVERVIVPVGGGGLISGIGLAIKTLKPSVEVIGVNAAVSPEMYNFFYHVDEPLSHETLADALPGEIEPGSLTFDLDAPVRGSDCAGERSRHRRRAALDGDRSRLAGGGRRRGRRRGAAKRRRIDIRCRTRRRDRRRDQRRQHRRRTTGAGAGVNLTPQPPSRLHGEQELSEAKRGEVRIPAPLLKPVQAGAQPGAERAFLLVGQPRFRVQQQILDRRHVALVDLLDQHRRVNLVSGLL